MRSSSRSSACPGDPVGCGQPIRRRTDAHALLAPSPPPRRRTGAARRIRRRTGGDGRRGGALVGAGDGAQRARDRADRRVQRRRCRGDHGRRRRRGLERRRRPEHVRDGRRRRRRLPAARCRLHRHELRPRRPRRPLRPRAHRRLGTHFSSADNRAGIVFGTLARSCTNVHFVGADGPRGGRGGARGQRPRRRRRDLRGVRERRVRAPVAVPRRAPARGGSIRPSLRLDNVAVGNISDGRDQRARRHARRVAGQRRRVRPHPHRRRHALRHRAARQPGRAGPGDLGRPDVEPRRGRRVGGAGRRRGHARSRRRRSTRRRRRPARATTSIPPSASGASRRSRPAST